MKRHLAALLRGAVERAIRAGELSLPQMPTFRITVPSDPSFGDLSTNVARVISGPTRRSPIDVAQIVLRHLDDPCGWLASNEIAGPGHLSFRLTLVFWRMLLAEALAAGTTFGRSTIGTGQRRRVVFLAGPASRRLQVSDGRAAVIADVMARLFEATGCEVERISPIDDLGRSDLARLGMSFLPPAAIDPIGPVAGFDRVLTVLAAGASAKSSGDGRAAANLLRVQPTMLTRNGATAPTEPGMPTAAPLGELLEQMGTDAVRFFFLRGPPDEVLAFDRALVRQVGSDNPMFYVQYAHVRCVDVRRRAETAGLHLPAAADLSRLEVPEGELLRCLAEWPDVVEDAARTLAPHRIIVSMMELAAAFHRYYNRHRILTDDPPLSQARVALTCCVQHVLRSALELAGVAAPERM